jgi:hypothetical protein
MAWSSLFAIKTGRRRLFAATFAKKLTESSTEVFARSQMNLPRQYFEENPTERSSLSMA